MKTIVIFDFMIKDLKLKGSELLIYALIYSFSQFGQVCFMKPENMAQALGFSRSQAFRALSSLLNRKIIFYSGDGYSVHTRSDIDEEVAKSLEEQIRIAKTPWLW